MDSVPSQYPSSEDLEMDILPPASQGDRITVVGYGLVTPETTPEPESMSVRGGEVGSAEDGDCEMSGVEADASSSSGRIALGSTSRGGSDNETSTSSTSLLFDWNWTVGGFSDAWEKRFGGAEDIS